MTAVLDVIIATVIGIVVIITIIVSIFNFQQMNYNVSAQLELRNLGDKVVEIIQKAYVDSVGVNLTPGTLSIVNASPTEFEYLYKKTPTTLAPTMRRRIRFETDTHGTFVTVAVRNESSLSVFTREFESTPVYIDPAASNFTYYDANDNLLTINNSSDLLNVRSIKINLVFTTPAWSNIPDAQVQYPISFWKYFKFVFINEPT